MPYFPILQKPTQNNLITKTSFRQDAPPRRGATALFRNPVCKAQRSVPGFSSTPTSACRRYATSPPPIVLRIHIVRHPSVCPIGAMHHLHRRKTAEERFHMLARGWLAYPVTPKHHPSTAEERLYTSTHGRFALSRRRATALFRNPVCKAQRSVPGFSSTPNSACRRYATSPPSAVVEGRGEQKKTDGWDSNHRSLYRYVLLCDYLLTTRRSLIRAFLPVRLRR